MAHGHHVVYGTTMEPKGNETIVVGDCFEAGGRAFRASRDDTDVGADPHWKTTKHLCTHNMASSSGLDRITAPSSWQIGRTAPKWEVFSRFLAVKHRVGAYDGLLCPHVVPSAR